MQGDGAKIRKYEQGAYLYADEIVLHTGIAYLVKANLVVSTQLPLQVSFVQHLNAGALEIATRRTFNALGDQELSFDLQDAAFSYFPDGTLQRIDYLNGSFKVFEYTASALTRMDYVVGATTFRKDFVYSSGQLTNIINTVI